MSKEIENGKGAAEGQDVLDKANADLATATQEEVIVQNPIMRFIFWVLSFTIPGLGMFCEAYFVFSVGNLKSIWKEEYPDCWKTHTTCDENLNDSITYTQVAGIICGQLCLGFAVDQIGRRWGSILTSGTMLVFGILMAASWGTTDSNLFLMFTIVQFFFGIGVGGEYPVASTSANERAESTKSLTNKRGETVVLVFSMQGWGNLVNTLVIAILLAIFGQDGTPYNATSLEVVWRLSYAIGLLFLLFIFLWRVIKVRESAVWEGKRAALKEMGKASKKELHRKYGLLLKYYWHRNFGTSASWLIWDMVFYGNKLFQGTFIKIINPTATLLELLLWTALNSAVALVGYYVAAFTIDKPWWGRVRLQNFGFLMTGLLFLFCAVFYHDLVQPQNIQWFQFLYYTSSFFGQFGPNASTWLLPAECAPTEVRSACHGFSAAIGKAGALIAGVIFGLVNDQTKFTISAACGLLGVATTWLFIPDLTGLDLREGDKRWLAILDGRHDAYTGEAVNPKHLSVVEKLLGYHKAYKATGAAPEGDHHTKALTVGGMVVGTMPEEGAGPDDVQESKLGKEASFQAKRLEYLG